MPARVSGSTATPAAAPSPTTTTSTGLRLVAMIFFRAAAGRVEFLAERLGRSLHALIFRPHGHFRAGVTDQIPAGEIFIAAIDRSAKHAFKREAARAIEKPAQVRRLVVVDRHEDSVP